MLNALFHMNQRCMQYQHLLYALRRAGGIIAGHRAPRRGAPCARRPYGRLTRRKYLVAEGAVTAPPVTAAWI
jgi:hypothetical protein